MIMILHNLSWCPDGGAISVSNFSSLRFFISSIAFSRWLLSSAVSWATCLWASSWEVNRPHRVDKRTCVPVLGEVAVWTARMLANDGISLFLVRDTNCLQTFEEEWKSLFCCICCWLITFPGLRILLLATLSSIFWWQQLELRCIVIKSSVTLRGINKWLIFHVHREMRHPFWFRLLVSGIEGNSPSVTHV